MQGTLSLDQQNFRFSEDEGLAIVTVLRTDGSDGEVSLEYATADGTATAGLDYEEQSGTVVFGDGVASQTIEIPILEDDILEGNETFTIAVGSESGGATLGFVRTATIAIEDNDTSSLDTLIFSQEGFRVSEDETEAVIGVTRLGDNSSLASVDFSISDDSAKINSDYLATSGTLEFAPGEISQEIIIPIVNDSLPEPSETLNILLENPTNVGLEVNDRTQLTIADDDEIPYTFHKTNFVSGLNKPTKFEWIPNTSTMLIAEQDGVVRVARDGNLLETPFWDGSDIVNSASQRGLLSITVHPDFENNPYVYLGYSIDREGQTPDGVTDRESVVVRVTADPATNYTTLLPGSLTTLLTIPEGGQFHATGDLNFGPDGYLYYSHGDGQDVVNIIDQPELLWSLNRPFSKQFRIDPLTGDGLPENPFYDGDPTSVASKVVNLGIRNSFRFTFNPETGEPVLGDVGWRDWEEINTGFGQNFGWPYFEGGNGESLRTPAYADLPNTQNIYDLNPDVTPAIFAYPHATAETRNSAVVVGEFYSGDVYPELYKGRLFFANSLQGGDVQTLKLGENGEVESNVLFAENLSGVTQYKFGDDGLLYTVDIATGRIDRWFFQGLKPEFIDTATGTDRLLGSPLDDELSGSPESDNIRGFNGSDLITGEDGNDSIVGGAGDDTLIGNSGTDTLIGSIGDDQLLGGNQSDEIRGGNGADTLDGGSGNDLLFGQGDDDQINGRAGDDTLNGGDEQDTLNGGIGDDSILGGAGDDLIVGALGDDIVFGNSGDDTITGNQGQDLLIGNSGDDSLIGNLGNDTLSGLFGNDILLGGSGNDELSGGQGLDELYGGDNDDTLFGRAGDTLDGGRGSDRMLSGQSTVTFRFGGELLDGVEDLDEIIGYDAVDDFDFDDYLGAGGTIIFDRLSSTFLRIFLSGQDRVNVFGSESDLNAAENKLNQIL